MTQPAAPRVVVVTADLGGNVPPALGIAAKLTTDGAAVHVIGHGPQEAAVTSLGLPFTAYTRGRAYDPLQARSGPATILGLAGLFCDQGVATDLLEVAAVHRADLLLVDCMLLGALAAGTRSGIPTVALVHSLPEFFTGRWSHGPIGMLAGLRGLRPAKVWGGLAGAVTATLPELAGSTTALGGPVVGPVWQGAPGGGTRLTGRPRVLVSLSTIWWPGQDAVAQRVLDALSGLDVDAVITTGPAVDPAPLTAPPNVELRRWADHGNLMPEADLVIGHGGHSTAVRALAHDLPLVLIPMHPMVDQRIVARVIAQHGAGLSLPRSATAAAIRDTVHRALTEPNFRAAAATLGARIRQRDGADTASEYLRAVASRHQSSPG